MKCSFVVITLSAILYTGQIAVANNTVAIEGCVKGPASDASMCIAKLQAEDGSFFYNVSISDAGKTVIVDSSKAYPNVDPANLTNAMAKIANGDGFSANEVAHFMGSTDAILKAVAAGTLPSNMLDRDANSIARILSKHQL